MKHILALFLFAAWSMHGMEEKKLIPLQIKFVNTLKKELKKQNINISDYEVSEIQDILLTPNSRTKTLSVEVSQRTQIPLPQMILAHIATLNKFSDTETKVIFKDRCA